mmetsp:Transcript_113901/g.307647  ORF Transcript_113901/g.307647 Transcript_113901/m.307647 type:complete len:270 (-) Transcript_113901:75-884(-)
MQTNWLLVLCLLALRAAAWSEPENDNSVLASAVQEDDVCTDAAEDGACAIRFLQLRAGQAAESAGRSVGAADETAATGGHRAKGGYVNHGGSNIRTLYHQTSPEAGASILATGFRLGTHHAICGSAIYFSPSVKDTDVKAVGGRGYIIEAKVDLGRIKRMSKDCNWHMTGAMLSGMGYNSITLDRGGYDECWRTRHCREYVIYDPRRVLSMKGFAYKGWKHWYSPMVASGDLGGDNSTAVAAHAAAAHVAPEKKASQQASSPPSAIADR